MRLMVFASQSIILNISYFSTFQRVLKPICSLSELWNKYISFLLFNPINHKRGHSGQFHVLCEHEQKVHNRRTKETLRGLFKHSPVPNHSSQIGVSHWPRHPDGRITRMRSRQENALRAFWKSRGPKRNGPTGRRAKRNGSGNF